MAFRIHQSVIRGEMDNRVKGIVRGRLWLAGHAEPVQLELEGNAWPDLAGCLLEFSNSRKAIPDEQVDHLARRQRGSVGDLTASRKVRVFDIPIEEAFEMCRRKEKAPEHLANSLYVEWYSDANGRVVVESADHHLTVSAREWRMTPRENAGRIKLGADALTGFMRKITEAFDQEQREQEPTEENSDESHD